MMVVAVANRKGGVGKTTVALGVATRLAESNRVLLVDLDSQANATEFLKMPLRSEVARWLIMEERPDLATVGRLDVMPGDAKTERVNMVLSSDADFGAIERGLQIFAGEYDWVFLDCPPSLSMLTKSALYAADYVLCPTTAEYGGVAGVRQLTQLVGEIQKKFHRPVALMGIQPNLYDARTIEHRVHLMNLARAYGVYSKKGKVWPVLRRRIAVATSSAEGKSVWELIQGAARAEWLGLVERVAAYG